MRPSHTPADPDFDRRVRTSYAAQPMMATLRAEITALGPGWIDIGFPSQPAFTQQHGFLHAGAVTTVLDSACGYAAFSLMPADAGVLTVELKVNLLRPMAADAFTASARVVKAGRTLTVCQAEAVPAGGTDPVAIMTATVMTLLGSSITG
ncbi:PaaI family thioesterase [Euzebya sp.]|uniref:PaaI family thioesterase n=1 Tax=Euzebya sp. TaxID=1971409 RepID=UPI003513E6C9